MVKNPDVNFSTMSLANVCTDFVTPVCSQVGETYVDYLLGRGGWMADKVGYPASCFISLSWKCMYAEMVEALEGHFATADPIIFLDLFCMSNYTVPSVEEHLQVLGHFDRVVHIVNPFENPVNMASARCLVDVYFASGKGLEMCMVPSEKKKFLASITNGHHKDCLNYVEHMDISKCKTFRGRSEDVISLWAMWKKEHHSISDEEVVVRVNEKVRERYLNEWILKTFNVAINGVENIEKVDIIEREGIELSWSDHLKLSRLECLSLLLRDVNRLHDSLEVRMKCVEVSSKVYGETSPLMGSQWMNVAVIQEMLPDLKSCLESFQKSLGLYLQEAGARAAITDDVIHEEHKKKQGMDAETKAKHQHDLRLPIGPVYYHIAHVFEKQGEYKEALLHYMKALEFSEKHAEAGHRHNSTSQRRHHAKISGPITDEDMPPHSLQGHIAHVYLQLGDLDKALAILEIEKKALIKLLGENDPSLAVVYGNMSTALQRRDNEGDVAAAEELYTMALGVAPNMELQLKVTFDKEDAKRIDKEVEAEEAAEAAADDL